MQDTSTQLEPIAPNASGDQRDNPRREWSSDHTSQSPHDGVLVKLKLCISKFWGRQISVVTGHEACRDHFANERTFLGYLRTSSAFATLGITSFQLFSLNDEQSKCNSQYGRGLALACEGVSILIALLGAWRFWRHQNTMLRGKMQAGGWDMNTVAVCGLIVTILSLVLLLLADCE